jgi:hypothetical protein
MRSYWIGLSALGLALLQAAPAAALCKSSDDMNGVWKSNDGGTYYIRQMGADVWWMGVSGDGGKTWANVFRGTRNGAVVTGQWADVPKGRTHGGGALTLRLAGGPTSVSGFSRQSATGGFGSVRWGQPCPDT